MKLSDLLRNYTYQWVQGEDTDINYLAYNTNDVKEGTLFFCIEGMKTDGHLYAQRAADNGAYAIVASKDIKINNKVAVIKVKNTREAMAVLGANFYGNPSKDMTLIGITGTNGKTTSAFIMKAILDSFGKKTGLLGTIYNIIADYKAEAKRTTPESLDLQSIFFEMKEKGVDTCIMEVSSHSLELKRVEGTKFKAGIFTNLTQDHLDFHGTMENYFNAKLKLFKQSEYAIINIDDEYGRKIPELIDNKIITYGIDNEANVYASEISILNGKTVFKLSCCNESCTVTLNLPGKFNIYNALSCAAASVALGVPIEVIKEGIEKIERVPGRSEKIETEKGFSIVIDYAHTPDGITNVLKSARGYTKGRLITLFGCGGDRDKTKRPLMGKAAGSLSDFCIVTSDNPRSEEPMDIINDIIPGINMTDCNYVIIEDRKKAIEYAIKNADKDDVVIIAGKGHETYQILKDKTIDFDERKIVNEILGN